MQVDNSEPIGRWHETKLKLNRLTEHKQIRKMFLSDLRNAQVQAHVLKLGQTRGAKPSWPTSRGHPTPHTSSTRALEGSSR